MKIGTENKRQMIIAGVVGFFALLAIYPLYQELFGGPAATPPPPPVIRDASGNVTTAGPAARTPASTSAAPGNHAAVKIGKSTSSLDPTLHMAGMLRAESVVYSGSGRNIFASGPSAALLATVAIPKPIKPARPVAPPRPMPPMVQGPPPIPLKFFGTATAPNGTRRAFLLRGDDVFLASAGDVVDRRYRVLSIAATSIQVEDLPNSNKQTLPLLAN